jgi:predicted MFS family arabinose efflux permease
MVAIALGQAQMSWNVSALPVSVGGIVGTFGVAPTMVSTAIVLYSLAVAGLIMAGARMGKRFGAGLVFRLGTCVFLLAMLATALSPSMGVVLFAQLIGGLAAAAIVPMLVVLIARHYEGRQRAQALGWLGGIQAMAVAAGFLIGGAVGTYYGWRWTFALVLPISAAALILSTRFERMNGDASIRVDIGGLALSLAGTICVAMGFNSSARWGILGATPHAPLSLAGFSPSLLLIAVGLALFFWFFKQTAAREARKLPVLVSLEVFRQRGQKPALVSLHATELVGSALLFLVPLYIQVVQGRSGLQTSVAMAPYQLAVFAAAVMVVTLYARFSARGLASAGFLLMAAGLLTLAFVMRNVWGDFAVVTALLVGGAGQGALMSVLTNTLVNGTPAAHAGDAGAMRGAVINLSAGVGTALAAAISVAFLATGIDQKLDGHPLAQTQFVNRLDLTEVRFLSNDELLAVAERHGATPEEAADAAMINEAARLKALKYSFFCLALIAVLPIGVAFFLPRKPSGTSG